MLENPIKFTREDVQNCDDLSFEEEKKEMIKIINHLVIQRKAYHELTCKIIEELKADKSIEKSEEIADPKFNYRVIAISSMSTDKKFVYPELVPVEVASFISTFTYDVDMYAQVATNVANNNEDEGVKLLKYRPTIIHYQVKEENI